MRTNGILVTIALAGLLGPGAASAQSDCENACEICNSNPDEWMNLGYGVGLHMTWLEPTESCTGPYSCVQWDECRAPESEEDAEPQDVLEAELDQLFTLENDQVSAWVRANRGEFGLAVVEGTLQVASRCGAVITWVPVEPSRVASLRALLEQE